MCSRGIFQLRKLSLYFCDFGGSSTGVRQFLVSKELKKFLASNAQIQFTCIVKRNHHPLISGSYLNGYEKNICLRSLEMNKIYLITQNLRNQIGRKSLSINGTRVINQIKSVQGNWQPNMFHTNSKVQMQKVYHIPWVEFQNIDKKIPNQQNLKPRDKTNSLLRLQDTRGKISGSQ